LKITPNSKLQTPNSTQGGVTLVLALIILSNILMIALAVGIFSLNQLKITISAKESTYAIFAATSGLERAFYEIRINNDCSNLFTETLSNNASYSVSASPCDQLSSTITSTGTYRQTSRKVEASW